MIEIINNLFIGDKWDSYNHGKHNIDVILNVTEEISKPRKIKNSVKYLNIPINYKEFEDVVKYFPTTNKYIGEHLKNNKRVLVHCSKGKSRSSLFIMAYLSQTMDVDEAYELIKSKKPDITPKRRHIKRLKTIKC